MRITHKGRGKGGGENSAVDSVARKAGSRVAKSVLRRAKKKKKKRKNKKKKEETRRKKDRQRRKRDEIGVGTWGGKESWNSEWDGLCHVTYSIAFRAATPRIDRTNISCMVGSVYSYLPPAGLTSTGHDHSYSLLSPPESAVLRNICKFLFLFRSLSLENERVRFREINVSLTRKYVDRHFYQCHLQSVSTIRRDISGISRGEAARRSRSDNDRDRETRSIHGGRKALWLTCTRAWII